MPIHTQRPIEPKSSSGLWCMVLSCIFGNALEWYDFALYGYFAAIIGKAMFPPHQSSITVLLGSYGIFFSGFVMRPLGAWLFGTLGDRHGRKKALMLSIYCMAIPTTLIGLLPPYAMVGIAAPLSLAVLRLFQGLSMGGEFTSSMVFVVEHAEPKHRGFWGSWISFSVLVGLIVGTGVSLLVSLSMSHEALEVWGWRIPFVLSSVGSGVGIYMRRVLKDPSDFSTHQKEPLAESPLRILFRDHLSMMGRIVLIDLTIAVGFFLVCIFIMTYLQNFMGFSYQSAAWINTLSMLGFAGVIPIAGAWSDRWSPKAVMSIGVWGIFVGAIPLFYGLSLGSWPLALLCQLSLAVLMGICFAPIPALLVSLFPITIRCSGVSLAHNVSMAFFGGSTPWLVTFCMHQTGISLMPGIILCLAALGSLIGLRGLKIPNHQD